MGDLGTQPTEQLRKPRPELTMPRQIEGNKGSVLLATKLVVGSLWRNSGAKIMELSLWSAELISTKALFNGSMFANKVARKYRYCHLNVMEFGQLRSEMSQIWIGCRLECLAYSTKPHSLFMVGGHRSSVAPVDLCNHCATFTHPSRPRAEAGHS